MGAEDTETSERLPLSKAVLYLLEECRMVLPGIQALLGFQLTVVFNPGFREKLSQGEQELHFGAIALLAVAMVLIMTPAAYHRQAHPHEAREAFMRLASRLLLTSMAPLAVSVCLELYLVGKVIRSGPLFPALTGGVFLLAMFFWFILPRLKRRS
jgi:hypothetical protein